MAEAEYNMDVEEGMVVSRIIIDRVVNEEGDDLVTVLAFDRQGELPPLVEMLGMIDLGRDTVYRISAGEFDE